MFTKVLMVCMVAASVRAIELYGHPYSHHGHHEEYNYGPAQYSFHYQVHDPKTGDIKSHQEERQGDNTKGEYSLVEPDGSRRTVQYTVDKHSGFNAVVHRDGSHHPSHGYGHQALNYGHGNYGHGHASSFSSYATPTKYIHSAPLIAHAAPIISHHQPIISHHQPIISHHQPIISHHQPIISHHQPIITHHQPILTHGGHGHATSSSSFSTHGAKIQTSTYHLAAPQIKKFY